MPFSIVQVGRTFRPVSTFNLRAYAAVPMTTTYYVDVNAGSDSNNGSSWAQAFKSIWKAASKSDASRVYIKAGYYYRGNNFAGNNPLCSAEYIADGGPVYVTTDNQNVVGPFAAVDSHYEGSAAGRTIKQVFDARTPDSFGDDVILTLKASAAEVDATPGSWYLSGGTLYVHTLDSRAPDGDLRYYEGGGQGGTDIQSDNKVFYLEGLHFRGGAGALTVRNQSAAGGLRFYAKDCSFKYCWQINALGVAGVDEVILWNCVAAKSADDDALNYHASHGVVPKVIEIDCEGYDSGSGTTNQGSTAHDGITIVRINGEYHHTRGQCVADVGGAYSWNLGTYMHDAESTQGNDDGFYLGNTGARAWLDNCTISVAHSDLVGEANTAILTRQLVSGGSNEISGTLGTY